MHSQPLIGWSTRVEIGKGFSRRETSKKGMSCWGQHSIYDNYSMKTYVTAKFYFVWVEWIRPKAWATEQTSVLRGLLWVVHEIRCPLHNFYSRLDTKISFAMQPNVTHLVITNYFINTELAKIWCATQVLMEVHTGQKYNYSDDLLDHQRSIMHCEGRFKRQAKWSHWLWFSVSSVSWTVVSLSLSGAKEMGGMRCLATTANSGATYWSFFPLSAFAWPMANSFIN